MAEHQANLPLPKGIVVFSGGRKYICFAPFHKLFFKDCLKRGWTGKCVLHYKFIIFPDENYLICV